MEEEKTNQLTMKSSQNVRDSNTLMRLLHPEKKKERKPRSRTLSYGEYSSDNNSLNEQFNSQKAGDLIIPEASAIEGTSEAKGNYMKSKVIDVAMLEADVLSTSQSGMTSSQSGMTSSQSGMTSSLSGITSSLSGITSSLSDMTSSLSDMTSSLSGITSSLSDMAFQSSMISQTVMTFQSGTCPVNQIVKYVPGSTSQ